MRTVGQILKEERLKKELSLEQVEKATRIRAKFLKAIEADSYTELPVLTYIQGFIRNYSDFLGLRTTTIMAMFRRQYTQKERERKDMIEEPLTNTKWQITPNKVILTSIIILIVGLFSYFYLQYQKLHEPPPLTIESPQDNVVVQGEEVPVFGVTDVDATLTVNNEPILVKDDGKFYADVALTIGSNILQIESQSRAGEKTTITKTVTRTQ